MIEAHGATSSCIGEASWRPIRLGALVLRNRLVMAPMVTLFPEDTDRPTPRHVAFYVNRARGGAGLIIVGATYVSPEGKGFPNQMGIDEDGKVPAFLRMVQQIQQHAPAILQLFHGGAKTSRCITGREVVASSKSGRRGARYDVARPLGTGEVEDLLAAYEAAAVRAWAAGFSGVEIHGANGYLIHEFSDKRSNQRTDRWRCLHAFPTELIRRLRRRLPATFLVGYTLSPFSIAGDDVADADSLRAFVELAASLAAAGIDYIHVYRGKAEPRASGGPPVYAETLRAAGLTRPIVEGAGIRSSGQAEHFLRKGATLAALGRALLGRPDLLAQPGREVPETELASLSTSEGLRRAFGHTKPARPSGRSK